MAPRVPQVQRAPLPGVRQSPSLPEGALGVASRGPDLSGVQKLIEDERDKADQVAVLDADNQLARLQTDLHTQATSRMGKDALGATQDVQVNWQKGASEIATGLHSERQRTAFANRESQRYQSLYAAVEGHAEQQRKAYDTQTTQDALAARANLAIADPTNAKTVQASVDETRAIVLDKARRDGWSDETRANALAESVSSIHAGVVSALLAKGNDLAATKYLTAHRSEFIGKDLVQADHLTEAGSVRGESQRQADTIVKKALDLNAALGEAAKITEPNVREATEERLRRTYNDRATAERQDREQAWQTVGEMMERTKDLDSVRATPEWMKLTQPQRDYFRSHESELRHPQRQTNEAFYANLINQSALNDATRAAFIKLDLTKAKYRAELSDADYEHILELQRSLREGGFRAEATTARKEETLIVKGAETQRKWEAERKRAEEIAPGASKYGQPRPPRVVVPQWMIDSAVVDTEYGEYLRQHGVKVPPPAAAAAQPGVPGTYMPPTVPGAPIIRALPGLAPAGKP